MNAPKVRTTFQDDQRLRRLRDKLIRDLTWELKHAERARRWAEEGVRIASVDELAEAQGELDEAIKAEQVVRLELAEMTGGAEAQGASPSLSAEPMNPPRPAR